MNRLETDLLRKELEMLIDERSQLLRVVGAAAVLVTNSDVGSLPAGVVTAAEVVSEMINVLPDETLKDALESVHAESDVTYAEAS